jgi:CIC family chloride channel protein
MADEVVRAYHRPDSGIDYGTALPKLTASIATMGFGASAGMEGASKWLGATIASYLQQTLNRFRRLKFFHAKVEITLLAGAAAGIGAIFRAPLTGAIMGIESPYKHDLASEALIHGLVASALSYATFISLRTSTPYFPIHFHYTIYSRDLLLCLPLGVFAGVGSNLFLGTLEFIKKRWGRLRASLGVKYLLGGVSISAVALSSYFVLGEPATLQAGLPVANRLLNGHYALSACLFIFAAKLLATALTFGMGGVGGLFVPSATIGAALGATCDVLFHPSQPGLFTLVGIAAFTGASYNSLLFSAVFVAEGTGSPAMVVPSLLASATAFLVSAGFSNSVSQQASRSTDDSKLSVALCRDWMTTRIVIANPRETLRDFFERVVTQHRFSALPVVSDDGAFMGLASLIALRSHPREKWHELRVEQVLDRNAKTLCPTHSMADVERELARGQHDYIPIVDPLTDQLIGILSSTDVLKAREQKRKELFHERTAISNHDSPAYLS